MNSYNKRVTANAKINEKHIYDPVENIPEIPNSFCVESYDYSNICVTRNYLRKGFIFNDKEEFYCYKVTFMDVSPLENIRQLNHQYDSCAGYDNNNLLICFFARIAAAGKKTRFNKKK
jgi:hypothetical protein